MVEGLSVAPSMDNFFQFSCYILPNNEIDCLAGHICQLAEMAGER